MASLFPRIALVGVSLVAGALLYALTVDTPSPEDVEQARIAEAVTAYTNQQQAEHEAATDALVASRANDLLRDPNTPIIGNSEGDVTLVEFFDYTCVFCKAADPRIRQLMQEDDGVRRVLKDFPVLTRDSLIAGKAGLASRNQGMYESYHNAMMEFRGQLTEARIFEIAEEVGLDVDRLREDMEAPEIADQIIENFNLARALRVYSTPTYFVNDRMINQPSAEIDFPATIAAARAR